MPLGLFFSQLINPASIFGKYTGLGFIIAKRNAKDNMMIDFGKISQYDYDGNLICYHTTFEDAVNSSSNGKFIYSFQKI